MRKLTCLLLLIYSILLHTPLCAQSAKARLPQRVITIHPDQPLQTLEGIGGNYCQAMYTDHARDSTGEYTLTHLRPAFVRFAIPLKKWEPVNDNAHADTVNKDGFVQTGVMKELFVYLKEMKEKRGVVNLTASVWDAPDWMVTDPAAKQQRKIPEALYAEAIESIAAFLVEAKEQYGVSIDYFSFNEADGGYQLKFTSQEIIRFIQMAGPRFRMLGLATKFLTGDVHKTEALLPYVEPILQEQSIRPFLGPISYHSWWSEKISDEEFIKIAALGKMHQLPVWCAEVGYDAFLWQKKGAHETWENAWRLAKIMHRVLKYSQASVTHYWTYQNNYPLTSKSGNPYPIFYIHKQLTDHFLPGSQMVESTVADTSVWVLAAKVPGNHFSVQLINNSDEEKYLNIQGLPGKAYNLIQTASGLSMQKAGAYKASSGTISLTLAPQSIYTLTTIENSTNKAAGGSTKK